MEHELGNRRDSEDMDAKPYGGYDSILRQRLSSMSSDSGTSGSPPMSSNPLDKMMQMEAGMAKSTEPIPLHWKSIPMPWK